MSYVALQNDGFKTGSKKTTFVQIDDECNLKF
jgi:hypothetical protein